VKVRGPRSWGRRLLLALGALLVTWVLATGLAVLLLRVWDPPLTAFIAARRLQAERAHEKGFLLRQQWVPLSRISREAQLALIAAEDQKFRSHSGFDLEAIQDALEEHREGKSSRGASTLTQQVAKNLFLWNGHSWVRKGLEVWFTVLIEALWPKRRILEMHLNIAELGNGVYGVEAASRTFLGKSAAALTLEEGALLASVLPNPRTRRVTAPSEQVLERAAWIVDQARHLPPDTLAGF
jgi:monofunctional biosynthetic peptidoglycan transglycosylase